MSGIQQLLIFKFQDTPQDERKTKDLFKKSLKKESREGWLRNVTLFFSLFIKQVKLCTFISIAYNFLRIYYILDHKAPFRSARFKFKLIIKVD